MAFNELFSPYTNATVSATATTSAGNITLPARASNGADVVRIYNAGTSTAFIEISTGTAAINTSIPIPAGGVEKFACPAGLTTLSVITAAGTAVIYATLGKGN